MTERKPCRWLNRKEAIARGKTWHECGWPVPMPVSAWIKPWLCVITPSMTCPDCPCYEPKEDE